jgi:nitroreductase
MGKEANPDHPVHELIAKRWSPYSFADRAVADGELLSLFEAARWAPSSYNAQPWSYIVARRHTDAELFGQVLSCLVEGNRAWAQQAPVLALGIVTLRFAHNDKPNAAARHDLGLAAGNLCAEAAARALHVHQMIGILPELARELFAIPQGSEAMTGLAIGYAGANAAVPESIAARDQNPRARKPLREFVFGRRWGAAAALPGLGEDEATDEHG